MKIQLHTNEQSYVVLTDPSRIKAQLESQPVARLLRALEGVIQALYLTGRWDAASCDKVAYALEPLVEVDDLEPRSVA